MNTENTLLTPQGWHNTRYAEFLPEHFTKLALPRNISMNLMLNWVDKNTTGRFGFVEKIATTNNYNGYEPSFLLNHDKFIGFELEEDATSFSFFYHAKNSSDGIISIS